MPIFGLGTDIIAVARLRDAAMKHPRLLKRIYTANELKHIESAGAAKWQRAAGKFAAKEAVAKAFGKSFSWQEVEILPDLGGKRPAVNLYGKAADALNGIILHLTISHCKEYASASAVLERL